MNRVADSSFLITLLDTEDPRRPGAQAIATEPAPILVPAEVVSEMIGVIHARAGYPSAQRLWDGLGEMGNVVHLNTTHQEDVAPIFLAAEGRLSWVDAAVVAHCLREDAEPLCFDQDIEAAYEAATGASGTGSG